MYILERNLCFDVNNILVCLKAVKYDHDDFCKRNAPECKCCCDPVCTGKVDQGRIPKWHSAKPTRGRVHMMSAQGRREGVPQKQMQ